MQILAGKKFLILGVANDYSLAWGIAQKFHEQGAKLAFSYLNEGLKRRVDPLAEKVEADFTFPLDVSNDDDYNQLADRVSKHWDLFDGIVHSIAFTDKTNLNQDFSETTRESFQRTMDISAYSLIGVSQKLKHMLTPNASIMSMTYHGSQKVIENYNVMGVAKAALEASNRYLAAELGEKGIRVNCISAGPVRTLAASAMGGFKDFLNQVEKVTPLKRNIDMFDVGNTAVYLASDLSTSVTGQTIYVDAGLSTLGSFAPKE